MMIQRPQKSIKCYEISQEKNQEKQRPKKKSQTNEKTIRWRDKRYEQTVKEIDASYSNEEED